MVPVSIYSHSFYDYVRLLAIQLSILTKMRYFNKKQGQNKDIVDPHNQLIWVIMSLAIIRQLQFPMIVTHSMIIYGYLSLIYRYLISMRFFDRIWGQNEDAWPHKQLVLGILSLAIVGLFQFPFVVTQNMVIYGYWLLIYKIYIKY